MSGNAFLEEDESRISLNGHVIGGSALETDTAEMELDTATDLDSMYQLK